MSKKKKQSNPLDVEVVTESNEKRSKAFFINGGAGRVLCSIPAFEKYEQESGDDDFIIVAEGGMDFYKGHPSLHKRAFDNWHKGLFEDQLKHRDLISPEPYRIWEYFNQKCNLAQAFDIEINNQDTSRNLQDPSIVFSKDESIQGFQLVQEVKERTGKDKVLVIQPFGRGVTQTGPFIHDSGSRSFEFGHIEKLINILRQEYGIIVMSEIRLPIEESEKFPIAQPVIDQIRIWASVISSANHFLGCDSVGQHIVKALGKTATVVVGSTFPENISYPGHDKFDIIDIGLDTRVYSPIRITMDDETDRTNNDCMGLSNEQMKSVLKSVRARMGKPTKFEGEYVPAVHDETTCTNPDHNHNVSKAQKKLAKKQEKRAKAKQKMEENKSEPVPVVESVKNIPQSDVITSTPPSAVLNKARQIFVDDETCRKEKRLECQGYKAGVKRRDQREVDEKAGVGGIRGLEKKFDYEMADIGGAVLAAGITTPGHEVTGGKGLSPGELPFVPVKKDEK